MYIFLCVCPKKCCPIFLEVANPSANLQHVVSRCCFPVFLMLGYTNTLLEKWNDDVRKFLPCLLYKKKVCRTIAADLLFVYL